MISVSVLPAFVNVVLPVVIIVGIGYLGRQTMKLDIRPFNRLSLYVLSPALIFSSLVRTDVGGDEGLRLAIFTAVMAVIITILAFLAATALRYDQASRNALALTTVFGNAGNFGLASCLFAFGQDGFQRAVILFIAQGFLLNTLAVYFASSANLKPRDALKAVFRMPVVYAAIAAVLILFTGLRVPDPMFLPLQTIGNAAIPMMLLTLGMQLVETPILNETSRVGVAVFGRLLLSPTLAYLLVPFFSLTGLAAKVAILTAAMPTAVTTAVLAIEFASWPKFVASVVIATTLLSIITLTALLSWLM